MKELWTEIDGFPTYFVSDHGRVRNWTTGYALRSHLLVGRGCVVRLRSRKGAAVLPQFVHDLVLENFYDRPIDRINWTIVHVDGDLTNNRMSNLKFERRDKLKEEQEHIARARNHNRKPVKIIQSGEVFDSIAACADHIGGSSSAISDCLKGYRQHHLGYRFEEVKR